MNKNLTLTGMMGVGKSTIGKALSKNLSMEFVDIDKVIEKKINLTIQKIFEQKGEPFFRKLEEEITLKELKKKNKIISLGGGAFMNNKIRNFVVLSTKSFWLDLKTDLIAKRLNNSKKRPLLIDRNIRKKKKKIYNERKSVYLLANHKIDCNNLSADLIVKKIVKLYEDN